MRDCALLSRARRMLQGDSRSNSAQRKRSFQSPSRPFSRNRSQSPARRSNSPYRVAFSPRPQVNSVHTDSGTETADSLLDADAWNDFYAGLDDEE